MRSCLPPPAQKGEQCVQHVCVHVYVELPLPLSYITPSSLSFFTAICQPRGDCCKLHS